MAPGSHHLYELAQSIDPTRSAELRRALPGAAGRAILLATAYPGLAGAISQDPTGVPNARATPDTALAKALSRYLAAGSADEFPGRLRRFARRQRWRIALRELLPATLGGADLEQTAAELSALADVTIQAALDEAILHIFERTGTPMDSAGAASRIVVLGMGKLGGNELNAGSDVDLVCVYDSDDHTAGEISAHEIWTKVVRRLTASLADVTEDGFVWRVDHRLRPEGSGGALVNSVAAIERYYETFGRLWERAAWIRARPVAGDPELGRAVLGVLRPFVWQKRVRPEIAVSMYELVHRARAELSAAPDRDLKLGPGGIREAEFFVQSLQLIWGGREPRVRTRSTLDAGQRLLSAGLITGQEGDDLAAAYVALRRAEHAVQWTTGIQTHSLPRDKASLNRIGRGLGFTDGAEFVADLAAQQERVSSLFRSLLPAGEASTPRWNDALLALDHEDLDAFTTALTEAGVPGADDHVHGQLVRDLFETARGHPDSVLGAHTRDRRRHLAGTLLDAVAGCADPTQAARFLRSYAARLTTPEIYAKLLADEPAAVRRLITLLGGSAFVGRLVATRPELADLVMFEHVIPTGAYASEHMRHAWAAIDPSDGIEEGVGRLRRAQSRVVTQVALADLAGELDTRESTEVLSALADEALECAARIALGCAPSGGSPHVQGLSVIAMGKLGGREIGYGSDLDVIFLFDPSAAPGNSDPAQHYTKVARKIIQIVSMPHPDGPAYELDTRLRPSGSQGMLVVSLAAFARYHGVGEPGASVNRAATWERLALLRARFAAGDGALGEKAIAVARRAAYEGGSDLRTLAQDVHHLRERMERELARERHGRYDIKLGRGGLIEVEFATQLLQLQHGAHAAVHTTDTRVALAALRGIDAISPEHCAALMEGCDFLRRLQQRLRIVHGDSRHLIEERATGIVPLARRMGIRDADGTRAAAALIDRYRAVTSGVRAAYEAIVVAPFRPDTPELDGSA